MADLFDRADVPDGMAPAATGARAAATFNLVRDAWLPVVRASGALETLRPGDLTCGRARDPVVRLDFPRADWNAAVLEWLIGLVWLSQGPEGLQAWASAFATPPSPADLAAGFARLAAGFDLDGDGPRAFQDPQPLPGEARGIAGLLIDAPGENAARKNTDLFVKRGAPSQLSLPYAAAALITLQTYAPSGGAGHRTSMRGGGPLSTLLTPVRRDAAGVSVDGDLWERIWANVPDTRPARPTDDLAAHLPWLNPTATSEAGQVVLADGASPAVAFFATPRRLRLTFAHGRCDWGGGEGPVATGFHTRPHGANYKGWIHPLSPYRRDPAGQLTALHPQTETFDAGSFRLWWGLDGLPARAVALWQHRGPALADIGLSAEIEAYGYDMDNMKARQWLRRRLPWAPLYAASGAAAVGFLDQATAALEAAVRSVVHALRISRFGQPEDGGYRLPAGLSRDALREVAGRLRARAEPDLLAGLAASSQETGLDRRPAVGAWPARLRAASLAAFAQEVDARAALAANPRRAIAARKLLASALSADGAVGRAQAATGLTHV